MFPLGCILYCLRLFLQLLQCLITFSPFSPRHEDYAKFSEVPKQNGPFPWLPLLGCVLPFGCIYLIFLRLLVFIESSLPSTSLFGGSVWTTFSPFAYSQLAWPQLIPSSMVCSLVFFTTLSSYLRHGSFYFLYAREWDWGRAGMKSIVGLFLVY